MTTSCYFFPFSALSSLHNFVCLLSFFLKLSNNIFISFLMSFSIYFSFAVCHIFLLLHNIEPCEKELLFFSLFFICLTICFSHILLFLGNQKQSMRMVLVWLNHSMHFIKVVFLSSVPFICLTIAYPDFYWICVTNTTACVRFSFSFFMSTNTSDYCYVLYKYIYSQHPFFTIA